MNFAGVALADLAGAGFRVSYNLASPISEDSSVNCILRPARLL